MFNNLKNFLLFIGHGRSGSSLLGSLIDAHPNAIISHEYWAVKKWEEGLNRKQILTGILQNSQRFREKEKGGYNYSIPSQYNGKVKGNLLTIGDKKASRTSEILAKNEMNIKKFSMDIGLPTKIIHTIRNPYDTISRQILARPKRKPLSNAIKIYFLEAKWHRILRGYLKVLSVYSEDFIRDKKETLIKICKYLELENNTPNYLEACTKIIYASPSRTREKIKWDRKSIDAVKNNIKKYPWLEHYTFED